jgi:hypothetical protein
MMREGNAEAPKPSSVEAVGRDGLLSTGGRSISLGPLYWRTGALVFFLHALPPLK